MGITKSNTIKLPCASLLQTSQGRDNLVQLQFVAYQLLLAFGALLAGAIGYRLLSQTMHYRAQPVLPLLILYF